jgi:hypothetical protein
LLEGELPPQAEIAPAANSAETSQAVIRQRTRAA